MHTQTTPQPAGPLDPADRFLDAIAAGTGVPSDLYRDDATLDATVPNWRLGASGPDGISSELSRWYHDPATIERVQRRPFPGGVALEVDFGWEDGGVPHASHQMHVLSLDGDRIAAHTIWCGGRWNADLLAEMDAARAH